MNEEYVYDLMERMQDGLFKFLPYLQNALEDPALKPRVILRDMEKVKSLIAEAEAFLLDGNR